MSSHGENMSVVKKNKYVLRILAEGDPKAIKYIIRDADRPLIHCFVDCAHNILEGNIPLGLKEKKRLAKYKEELRALRKKNTSDRKKKQILQKGGFLPALLAPILGTVIPPLAKKLVGLFTRR